MTRHIDTATLRDWLEQDRRVTVLDIASNEDRTQWAIPGSVHINAYEALRKGEPGRLQDAVLPSDRPVVTVCNAGRMSEMAADFLTERGIDCAFTCRRHEGLEHGLEHRHCAVG